MKKYHISHNDMNKSVRVIGSLIRALSPDYSEEIFH